MIGSKNFVLSILHFAFDGRMSQKPCEWGFNDTYEQLVKRHLSEEMNAPEDGICLEGLKWFNFGLSSSSSSE